MHDKLTPRDSCSVFSFSNGSFERPPLIQSRTQVIQPKPLVNYGDIFNCGSVNSMQVMLMHLADEDNGVVANGGDRMYLNTGNGDNA